MKTFDEYWEQYGELHASMCGGDIKQFAKEIWESAIVNADDEKQALQDCLNGSTKAVYTAEMYDALKDKLEKVYEAVQEALDYARDEETCRMVIPALEQILEGGR